MLISTPRDPDLPETLAQNAARFGMDSRKHLAPKIQALADPEVRIKRIYPTAQALGSMRETRPKKSRGGEHGTRDRELEAGSSGFYGTNSTIASRGKPTQELLSGGGVRLEFIDVARAKLLDGAPFHDLARDSIWVHQTVSNREDGV